MKKGTSTLFLIHPSKIPKHTKITYVKFIASIRLLRLEKYRVITTAGGDRLDYNRNVATDQATLLIVKTYLNSTISMEGAHLLGLDIKDFYYVTPMAEKGYEYSRMPLNIIPK